MNKIKIGDTVYDPHGHECAVVESFPRLYPRDLDIIYVVEYAHRVGFQGDGTRVPLKRAFDHGSLHEKPADDIGDVMFDRGGNVCTILSINGATFQVLYEIGTVREVPFWKLTRHPTRTKFR